MVSEEETKSIRRFVCGELRDGPDLRYSHISVCLTKCCLCSKNRDVCALMLRVNG